MILVRVIAIGSKDQVRRDCALKFFEDRFYFRTHEGNESVLECLEEQFFWSGRADEQRGCAARLGLPGTDGTKHHPVKRACVLLRQPENRPATPNFDIVGVGSQA